MYKICTPAEWYSIFNNYSLVIDDEGYIYDNYEKLMPIPVGKIDFDTGYIYGKDYAAFMPIAIGRIEENGDEKVVYGTDYAKCSRRPLFHICDSKIYSEAEYYKLFPQESGYIYDEKKDKGDKPSTKEESQTINSAVPNQHAPSANLGIGSGIITSLIYLFVCGVTFGVCAWSFTKLFTDKSNVSERNVFLFAAALAIFFLVILLRKSVSAAKSYWDSFEDFKLFIVMVDFIMTLSMDIYYFKHYKDAGEHILKCLFMGFFTSSIVSFLAFLIPSVVICFITISILYICLNKQEETI